MARRAFREAAEFFVQVVEQAPEDRWDSPGLGVWTVRDLVGHTLRALTTVEEYSAMPAAQVEVQGPVDYFQRGLSIRDVHAQIAQRGREVGQALGDRPADVVRETARRVLAGLERVPDGAILSVPMGGMRLMDYLPTRIFELTIHTLDLGAALGKDLKPPAAPMGITLHLLADLALSSGSGPALALAVTGHRRLPQGFSLLG
jgi:uncharacterized protein (TIGR03083 family)